MEKGLKEIDRKNILKDLSANLKLYLPIEELERILSFAVIISEQNTLISDYIRILKIEDHIMIQEKTDKNEIALHLVKDEQEATEFVNERLETYEKMWDGCGCKIKYYD